MDTTTFMGYHFFRCCCEDPSRHSEGRGVGVVTWGKGLGFGVWV